MFQAAPAAMAQLGERQTEDPKVPGSIPGLGTFRTSLKLWPHGLYGGANEIPTSACIAYHVSRCCLHPYFHNAHRKSAVCNPVLPLDGQMRSARVLRQFGLEWIRRYLGMAGGVETRMRTRYNHHGCSETLRQYKPVHFWGAQGICQICREMHDAPIPNLGWVSGRMKAEHNRH